MAELAPETKKLLEERQELLQKFNKEFRVTEKPTLYERLQAITRGQLFIMCGLLLLGICLVLFFPTKAWHRLMLNFVDCVVVHGKKYDYKICNQDHPNDGVQL
jgi:hypothetical protein